jgi:hypothetical protein
MLTSNCEASWREALADMSSAPVSFGVLHVQVVGFRSIIGLAPGGEWRACDESARFEFNHQPLDLFTAASPPLRDLFVCHHPHSPSNKPAAE